MIILSLFSSPTGDISPSRRDLEKPLRISPSTAHPFLKLSDYFQAAQAFLLDEHRDSFLDALREGNGTRPEEKNIRKVTIRSEKQGPLYHVASVEVEGKSLYDKFSLISAVTATSRKALEREFQTLTSLNRKCSLAGLPKVYFKGTVKVNSGEEEEDLSFFLGEWFEEYHEWHLSRDRDGNPYLCIWDLQDGHRAASEKEFTEIFRQASRILTLLYDPETSRQVGPWHHAAGDFVIGHLEGEPHVRLTTSRGYEPLLAISGQGPGKNLANLLFFFLDMGLRMRLDRLDGVGEVAWIEGNIPLAVTEGFFDSLKVLSCKGKFKKTVARDFFDLLKCFSPTELITTFQPLLEIYQKGAQEELRVIMEHLPGHVKELCSITEKFSLSNPVSAS